MTEQLFSQIASTGVVGALLVIALLALRAKDKELKAEMTARIADSERFNQTALAIQKEVMTAVSKLAEMVKFTEERIEERDKLLALLTDAQQQHAASVQEKRPQLQRPGTNPNIPVKR